MSQDEFEKKYNQAIKPSLRSNSKNINSDIKSTSSSFIDWTGVYTTPVKDQGYCGSCWAFSATEQIESDSIRLGLLTTSDTLSTEQIVQCDTFDDGCGGGNTETAFEYVRSAGGIESDSDYPYTSYYDYTGSCSSNSLKYKVTVDEYYSLSGEESMITHIFSTGPISVCLDASSWSSYVSGVITTCGMEVDHCVQAVGVNLDEWYWVVRNSWGTEWGNEGYIWLEVGSNMCNIAYDPTYVVTSVV
jgi:C1A family cysteine protease